jgi:shikimate kinase
MLRRFVVCACLTSLISSFAMGQEHRVEVMKEAPKAKGLSKEMAAMLAYVYDVSGDFHCVRESSHSALATNTSAVGKTTLHLSK